MHELSFDVYSGEIFGITGLIGAGRTELARALFGIDSMVSGSVHLDNNEVRIRSVRDAVRNGIYLIPEDRRNCGLITEMSVMENLTLPDLKRHGRWGFIQKKSEMEFAEKQCSQSNIKTADIHLASKNLSGGNQQKIVICKWLSYRPQVVILDEPTRGIDVGAKAEIYKTLRMLTDQGIVVVVISSDMEEVMSICDRIMVMHEGKMSGILRQSECTEEYLMNLAVGKTGYLNAEIKKKGTVL
jgi:ribose transport system ATP-binding protein